MKARNKIACIVPALVSLLFSGSALSASEHNTTALSAFIESLLVDEDETATSFDWSWGSEAGDPVRWRTPGIEAAPKRALTKYGPYERLGDVVLSGGGDGLPELKQNEIPDGWFLALRGPQAGFTSVTLENSGDSQALCLLTEYYLASLAKDLPIEPYRCKNEPASAGVPVYTVVKKGKKKAWLINEYGGGTAGCSLTLELIFDQARADQVMCLEDVDSPKSDWNKLLEESNE